MSLTAVRASIPVCLAVAFLAAPSARAEDARAAAHEHFDNGMAASNDQRFAEAVTEFERAYALWPDYRVLYNIGKIRATLGRSAESVAAFEAYLEKGGAQLSDERKQEVRDAMAAQLAHVSALEVRVSAKGAEVRVDGKLIGRSPLAAPVRLTEGKHTVEAILPGRPSQLRELELPGASKLAIDLAFPAPPPAPVALSAAAAPVVVGESSAPAPRRRWRLVGFGVAGAGAAAAVAGAVVAYRAATDANAARALMVEASMPSAPATPDLMKYDAAKRGYDAARTRNQLGWALVGAGVAAVAGGLTIAILPGGLSFGGTW